MPSSPRKAISTGQVSRCPCCPKSIFLPFSSVLSAKPPLIRLHRFRPVPDRRRHTPAQAADSSALAARSRRARAEATGTAPAGTVRNPSSRPALPGWRRALACDMPTAAQRREHDRVSARKGTRFCRKIGVGEPYRAPGGRSRGLLGLPSKPRPGTMPTCEHPAGSPMFP